jgi:hypothetical protein
MKTLPSQDHHAPAPGGQAPDILWIAAVALAATMTISVSYHARPVTGACWLALAALSLYALQLLKHLQP